MLKLNKIITISVLLATSLNMHSALAGDTNLTESMPSTERQNTLTDWNQKTSEALTLRLEQKLETQMIAKNYDMEEVQVAQTAKPVSHKSIIVLAEYK